jgi:HAD superfamily hydrolase (TIGR01490 family)
MTPPERIAAFFDLDGTLLPSPSLEWRWIGFLLGRDEISSKNLGDWVVQFARMLLRDPRGAIEANKFYLAGLGESAVTDWENSLPPDSLPLHAGGIERLAWHAAQQHRVFLVTGTLAPLARAVARRLPGRVAVCATELEVFGGRWTGRLAGEHLSGARKARAVSRLSREYGLELGSSYAYGDQLADLPMLEAVGNPVAVNPTARLGRVAEQRGWQIRQWRKLQPASYAGCAQWFAPEAK